MEDGAVITVFYQAKLELSEETMRVRYLYQGGLDSYIPEESRKLSGTPVMGTDAEGNAAALFVDVNALRVNGVAVFDPSYTVNSPEVSREDIALSFDGYFCSAEEVGAIPFTPDISALDHFDFDKKTAEDSGKTVTSELVDGIPTFTVWYDARAEYTKATVCYLYGEESWNGDADYAYDLRGTAVRNADWGVSEDAEAAHIVQLVSYRINEGKWMPLTEMLCRSREMVSRTFTAETRSFRFDFTPDISEVSVSADCQSAEGDGREMEAEAGEDGYPLFTVYYNPFTIETDADLAIRYIYGGEIDEYLQMPLAGTAVKAYEEKYSSNLRYIKLRKHENGTAQWYSFEPEVPYTTEFESETRADLLLRGSNGYFDGTEVLFTPDYLEIRDLRVSETEGGLSASALASGAAGESRIETELINGIPTFTVTYNAKLRTASALIEYVYGEDAYSEIEGHAYDIRDTEVTEADAKAGSGDTAYTVSVYAYSLNDTGEWIVYAPEMAAGSPVESDGHIISKTFTVGEVAITKTQEGGKHTVTGDEAYAALTALHFNPATGKNDYDGGNGGTAVPEGWPKHSSVSGSSEYSFWMGMNAWYLKEGLRRGLWPEGENTVLYELKIWGFTLSSETVSSLLATCASKGYDGSFPSFEIEGGGTAEVETGEYEDIKEEFSFLPDFPAVTIHNGSGAVSPGAERVPLSDGEADFLEGAIYTVTYHPAIQYAEATIKYYYTDDENYWKGISGWSDPISGEKTLEKLVGARKGKQVAEDVIVTSYRKWDSAKAAWGNWEISDTIESPKVDGVSTWVNANEIYSYGGTFAGGPHASGYLQYKLSADFVPDFASAAVDWNKDGGSSAGHDYYVKDGGQNAYTGFKEDELEKLRGYFYRGMENGFSSNQAADNVIYVTYYPVDVIMPDTKTDYTLSPGYTQSHEGYSDIYSKASYGTGKAYLPGYEKYRTGAPTSEADSYWRTAYGVLAAVGTSSSYTYEYQYASTDNTSTGVFGVHNAIGGLSYDPANMFATVNPEFSNHYYGAVNVLFETSSTKVRKVVFARWTDEIPDEDVVLSSNGKDSHETLNYNYSKLNNNGSTYADVFSWSSGIDVDTDPFGKHIAAFTKDGYTVYILTKDEKITFNEDCSYMFGEVIVNDYNNETAGPFTQLCSIVNRDDVADTSHVRNMEGMFYDCRMLGSYDLNYTGTYSGNEGAESSPRDVWTSENANGLDLRWFDTSSVTNMKNLFRDVEGVNIYGYGEEWRGLTVLDISSWDTGNVENMEYMFSAFSSSSMLTTIYASEKFVTDAVTSSSNMFQGCTRLTGGSGTKASAMKRYDKTCAKLDKEGQEGYFTERLFDTPVTFTLTYDGNGGKVEGLPEPQSGTSLTASCTFTLRSGKPQREGFVFSGWAEQAVLTADAENAGASGSAARVYQPGASYTVTAPNGTADGGIVAKTLYAQWIDRSTLRYNLATGAKLKTAIIKAAGGAANVKYAVFGRYADYAADAGTENSDDSGTAGGSQTASKLSASGAGNVANALFVGNADSRAVSVAVAATGNSETGDDTNAAGSLAFAWEDGVSAGATQEDRIKVFYDSSKTAYILVDGGGILANEDCQQMFADFTALEYVDFGTVFDTANVTSTYRMFYNCKSLRTIDGLEHWDTQNMTELRSMFYLCTSLEAVDLSSFDSKKLTNLAHMFRDCKSLKELDLRSFAAKQYLNTNNMFDGCTNLTTIYAAGTWTASNSSSDMFNGCISLVGGNGTKHGTSTGTNQNNASYAKIDKDGQAGYFTAADFDKAVTYILHYDGNGGNAVSLMQQGSAVRKSYTFTIPMEKPLSPDGSLYFYGWAESSDAGEAAYQPGGTYTVLAPEGTESGGSVEKTLYAVWKLYTPVTGVTLSPESLELSAGSTASLAAKVLPENASLKDLRWESSDTTVATVDENGKVTGVAAGTAAITVRSTENAEKFAACQVQVYSSSTEAVANGKAYTKLTDAINAAQSGGDGEVRLLKDIENAPASPYQILAKKELILDLNGHSIKDKRTTAVSNYTFEVKGSLAVVDKSMAGGGRLESTGTRYMILLAASGASLTVGEGVTVAGKTNVLQVTAAGCSVTLEGGTIAYTNNATGATIYLEKGGFTFTMRGGTLSQAQGANVLSGTSGNTAILDISGGTLSGKVNPNLTVDATITGGTFSFDPSAWLGNGYVAVPNADGTWTVQEGEAEPVTATVKMIP